ncbi:MAG: HAD family hydrolase [Planctomycetota bacterium]|nr:HAD family hydrolase [Planctomycetota bacterium]MDA0920773.1 HAD family hydrolase [Planctomycetota bacterium]MDA1158778.1 HAD family hydrolase [Planctomycetota bacterium]
MSFRSTGKYDLVICDIDGCLSPESHAPINDAALSKIADHNRLAVARKDRPIVTLCSGRPISFVEAMCRFIHNTLIPCIGENGVWLYFPDVNKFEMDPAITAEHLEAVHAASRLLRDKYRANGIIEQPGKSAAVTLHHPDTAYLRSILPAVRNELADHGWSFRVSMTWFYINCDLTHVNKASGINRLFAETGIDRSRTAAIGDTMGDKFMADSVSFFACPANAEPEIQQSANYISPHAEVDGVLDILRRLND